MAKQAMSDGQKKAMARGRSEGKAIREYLEAVTATRRPGRPQTVESLTKRIVSIRAEIESADALRRLHLLEKERQLETQLDAVRNAEQIKSRIETLEKRFVEVAKEYGERKTISYATWRKAGVPADVLRRAKIAR